tara:strand:+ start:601 stop:873 length:273 start_codon:yes stop_codon:yes gene_type:complete
MMNVHEAIREIYSNVVTIRGRSENDIVAYDIDGNEVSITDWDSINAKITELDQADKTAETNRVNLKASAKAKLVAGEKLTEDEANVLVGV